MLGSVGLGLGSVGTAAGQDGGGENPSTDDVLVKVYANGLGDPQTNEVMHMPHADLRFLGQNPGYPGFAYLEDHPSEADSRFGAEYYGRYYPTAQGVGGFAVRQVSGFDPNFNGTFGGLGGVQIVDIYGFRRVNDPTGPGMDIAIGQQRWAAVGGFFDGPIAYPTPGFNSGNSEHLWIDLWNDFSGGFFTHPALDLNGYGQPTFNVISKAQGVLTAGLNIAWWNGPSPLALDGPGIFFSNGNADPPLGIIANRLLNAGGANGPTQLAFYTSSAPGTLGTPIATFDWTSGIVFNAPISFAGSVPVVQAEISADVDLAATSSGTVIAPAVPGKIFVPVRVQLLQTVTAGAMSTPATIQIMQGASTLLAPTSTLTNATAFGFGANGITQSAPTQATLQLSTATTVDVTVAATGTGGFAYRTKVILTGYYV